MPLSQTCNKCKLPIAPKERAGSLTSFLFVDMHCHCQEGDSDGNRRQSGGRPGALSGSSGNLAKANLNDSCKRCGKVIPSVNRPGSFTAFMLKDMRCNCSKPLRSDQSDLKTRMVLDPARMTRRRNMMTAMRTRAHRLEEDAELIKLAPGTLIGGCYELMDMIGEGGMGLVYRAKHNILGRLVALKFLAPSMVSQTSWAYFQREAKISSSLMHSSICHIYDLGVHAGVLPFYAMDYLHGETLEEIITDNGPLSVGGTLEVFIKVAEGLSYAHRRNVIHRDIKPANIMVIREAQEIQIKILDFGISELAEETNASQRKSRSASEQIVGSASYMSPEQFGGQTVDPRSDIYSMGCAIFETLTGRPPFLGETFDEIARKQKQDAPPLLSSISPDFDTALDAVLQKCMQKNRDLRYQNANELAIDLARILENKDLQFAREQLTALVESKKTRDGSAQNARVALFVGVSVALTALVLGGGMAAVSYVSDMMYKSKHKEEMAARAKYNGTKQWSEVNVTGFDDWRDQSIARTKLPPIKDGEFFQGESVRDGRKVVTYKFPLQPRSTLELAELQIKDSHADNFDTFNCSGVVTFDKDSIVYLIPHNAIDDPYNYFRGFRPIDINGVNFGSLVEDSGNFARAAAQRFTSTSYVKLGSTQKNYALFDSLSAMHMPELVIEHWNNRGSFKGQIPLPRDGKLDKLILRDVQGDFSSFFKGQPFYVDLRLLELDRVDFKADDYALIAHIPKINEVAVNASKIDSASIVNLLKSPTLENIYFNECKLDIDDLVAPLPRSTAKTFHVRTRKTLTPRQIRALDAVRIVVPRVVVSRTNK